MKVLVLGATGQIGANLVRTLVARGHDVRALLRRTSNARTLEGVPLERVTGDLSDGESLVRACQGVRVLYHCAAYYPPHILPVGDATAQALAETRNVLEAVRRASVERVVYVSTLTTIGFPPDRQRLADETCAFATSYRTNAYLIPKAAMEDAVLQAAKGGLPAVVVNPTACFGPFDSKPTSGTQILMIAKHLMPAYVGGRINAIDVRDVAQGIIAAGERGRVGERYILGNWNTTQRELNELIARVVGVTPPLVRVPFALARYGSKLGDWACRTLLRRPPPIPGFFVEMLPHMQHYDCSKALGELGYPQSPVEQAIRDAVTWFRENGYLRAA